MKDEMLLDNEVAAASNNWLVNYVNLDKLPSEWWMLVREAFEAGVEWERKNKKKL